MIHQDRKGLLRRCRNTRNGRHKSGQHVNDHQDILMFGPLRCGDCFMVNAHGMERERRILHNLCRYRSTAGRCISIATHFTVLAHLLA
eukprot:3024316-Pleurochrysis_carterae.AAC.1